MLKLIDLIASRKGLDQVIEEEEAGLYEYQRVQLAARQQAGGRFGCRTVVSVVVLVIAAFVAFVINNPEAFRPR